MLPDHDKPLADNLDTLGLGLKHWATVLAACVQTVPEERRILRMSLRTLAGGLNFASNEAHAAAREARRGS